VLPAAIVEKDEAPVHPPVISRHVQKAFPTFRERGLISLCAMAFQMAGRTDTERAEDDLPRASRRRWSPPRWVGAVFLISVVIALLAVPFGTRALNAAIEGVILGSIYVLGASGLSLTYGIKKFANFAHGDMMTVGAYVAFTLNVALASHIILGFFFAMITVALLGVLLELSIFRRLEGRGAVAALIASVGVSLVLQNTLSAIFTTNVQYLNVAIPSDFVLGGTGLRFNAVRGGATLAISAALIIFLHVMLKRTTLGKSMRACADDMDLARTSGIRVRNVILWTWAIAGAFAAVAGVLLAIVVNVYPLLGFFILLFIFAAVIVGGIGSPYGAMIGGLIIGVVQKLSNVIFSAVQGQILEGGAEYEPVGAFVVMILVLLFMPEGLMGTRLPVGARTAFAFRIRRRPVEVEEVV